MPDLRNNPDDTAAALAEAFVTGTSEPVFLTGKAETGKTTFLRRIRSTTGKAAAMAQQAPRFLYHAPHGEDATGIHADSILRFRRKVRELTARDRGRRQHPQGRLAAQQERHGIGMRGAA